MADQHAKRNGENYTKIHSQPSKTSPALKLGHIYKYAYESGTTSNKGMRKFLEETYNRVKKQVTVSDKGKIGFQPATSRFQWLTINDDKQDETDQSTNDDESEDDQSEDDQSEDDRNEDSQSEESSEDEDSSEGSEIGDDLCEKDQRDKDRKGETGHIGNGSHAFSNDKDKEEHAGGENTAEKDGVVAVMPKKVCSVRKITRRANLADLIKKTLQDLFSHLPWDDIEVELKSGK